MRRSASALVIISAALGLPSTGLVAACSSSKFVAAPDAGPAVEAVEGDAATALPDGEGADAAIDAETGTASDGGLTKNGCRIEFSPKCPESQSEDGCDVLAYLPGGGEYCTLSCASQNDCPTGVLCNPNAGACLPPCSEDAPCKASGFLRCDKSGGTCTTIGP